MRVNDAKQGTLFIENILIALWAGCLFGTLHSVWALMIFLDTPPKPPSPPSTQTFFSLPPPYHPAALWDIVVVIYLPSLIVTIILTLRRRGTNVNRRLMKGNETFLATELKSVKFQHSPILHLICLPLPWGKQICFTIVWGCAEILPWNQMIYRISDKARGLKNSSFDEIQCYLMGRHYQLSREVGARRS